MVGDVFIPAKSDKIGNQFGLVRFRGVRDVAELLRMSYEICILDFKLRFNLKYIARFDIFSPKTQFPFLVG